MTSGWPSRRQERVTPGFIGAPCDAESRERLDPLAATHPLGIIHIGGHEFLVSVSDPGRAFPRPVPLPAPAPEPVERAGATRGAAS